MAIKSEVKTMKKHTTEAIRIVLGIFLENFFGNSLVKKMRKVRKKNKGNNSIQGAPITKTVSCK